MATSAAAGIDFVFMQENHFLSAQVGTLRVVHFQSAPFARDKLVRLARGRILDVAVDLRASSPSFGPMSRSGSWPRTGASSSCRSGFAHGFVTIEPHTEVL
jgi:dTDP-4-dehydrorhamnose 3,5-epimerase